MVVRVTFQEGGVVQTTQAMQTKRSWWSYQNTAVYGQVETVQLNKVGAK